MLAKTRLRSSAMRLFSSQAYLDALRRKARWRRALTREAAAVHYFHQVDDPYSHLAVQKLGVLQAAYDIPFHTHLVSKPAPEYQGSSAHFDTWGLRDALSVASDYNTILQISEVPPPERVHAALNALAPHAGTAEFAERALSVGTDLWNATLAPGAGLDPVAKRALQAGDRLRRRRGHYQGAMFYFDGEWFWGIDRLRLLELRLIEEGLARDGRGAGDLCVPEPTPVDTTGAKAAHVELEYFPSLRSPYTAIGHARIVDLVERSGVTLKLRPVMPMLMRGIPAPAAKQRYIIIDAGREARARGVRFGHIVDPFGEPVKQAFALFPAAQSLGRGLDFVTIYLQAAWAEGWDITTEEGLRQVARGAAINWQSLEAALEGTDWEADLADNLSAMLAAGFWGVPSFRVSGGRLPDAFACWGQDRIWRVENEIARRA